MITLLVKKKIPYEHFFYSKNQEAALRQYSDKDAFQKLDQQDF